VEVGDSFVLNPGPQGAEGGVYFSEQSPRNISAAEGCRDPRIKPIIVCVLVTSTDGWWRTKASIAKKFNRPRTWHTDNKSIKITVEKIGIVDGFRAIFGKWVFSNFIPLSKQASCKYKSILDDYMKSIII
jgi:hypothetical protein